MRVTGGKYKNIQIRTSNKGVRPSSAKLREALFNLCQSKIENAYFLDLYAGSGAIGIEALSRGAKYAVFVDRDKDALKILKKNLLKIGVENRSRVFLAETEKALQKLKNESILFDLVYIDPPYSLSETVYHNALPLIASPLLLNPGAWIFFEKEYSKDPLPIIDTQLQLVKSRKYGNSHLHQFNYQN